jgi:hypothetical protein
VKFVLLSSAIVVAFDALASVASAVLHFPYVYAGLGSVFIYTALALVAALRFGFVRGLVLGATLGLVDATIGWAVSWAIGPGRVPPGGFGLGVWFFTLLSVVGVGALCGLIGAGIGGVVRKSRAA